MTILKDNKENNMPKTDFFLIGAPKCGTTAIYSFLKQHPQVFLPEQKELHFFSYPEVTDTYYNVKFIKSLREYEECYYNVQEEKILGDISPSYLYYSLSAERIRDYNKDAKIVAILRNPVDRAISHYLMDVRIGYQDESFKEIIFNKNKYPQFYKEYIGNSFYSINTKKFNEIFKDNFLLLLYRDLVNKPIDFMEKLYKFLDIDIIHLDYSKKYNKYTEPRSKYFIHRYRKSEILQKTKNILPNIVINLINKMFFKDNLEKPKYIDEKIRLMQIFKEDSMRIEKMFNLIINDWN